MLAAQCLSPERPSDESLIIAFVRDEDGEALDELYKRYRTRIRNFHRIRCHYEEADDLTQDTFIEVVRSSRTFDPTRGSFRTWLYRIAAHTSSKHRRRRALERIVWGPMDDSVSTSELATSESTVAAGAERSWLLKQLKRLSPREQEILFLFGDGHTDQQISDILHSGPFKALKAKGVSSVRSRALDRLRQMMEDGHGKQ